MLVWVNAIPSWASFSPIATNGWKYGINEVLGCSIKMWQHRHSASNSTNVKRAVILSGRVLHDMFVVGCGDIQIKNTLPFILLYKVHIISYRLKSPSSNMPMKCSEGSPDLEDQDITTTLNPKFPTGLDLKKIVDLPHYPLSSPLI